jgi:hypothetical protein
LVLQINKTPKGTFDITAQQAYHLLFESKPNNAQLKSWWQVQETANIWKIRWQLLWGSDISLRAKTFIWQVISNRLFTNERAKKFGHGTGNCKTCPSQIENAGHIFYDCIFARQTWEKTNRFYFPQQQNNIFGNSNLLLDLIDHCLWTSSLTTTTMLVLYETVGCSSGTKQYLNPIKVTSQSLIHRVRQVVLISSGFMRTLSFN